MNSDSPEEYTNIFTKVKKLEQKVRCLKKDLVACEERDCSEEIPSGPILTFRLAMFSNGAGPDAPIYPAIIPSSATNSTNIADDGTVTLKPGVTISEVEFSVPHLDWNDFLEITYDWDKYPSGMIVKSYEIVGDMYNVIATIFASADTPDITIYQNYAVTGSFSHALMVGMSDAFTPLNSPSPILSANHGQTISVFSLDDLGSDTFDLKFLSNGDIVYEIDAINDPLFTMNSVDIPGLAFDEINIIATP